MSTKRKAPSGKRRSSPRKKKPRKSWSPNVVGSGDDSSGSYRTSPSPTTGPKRRSPRRHQSSLSSQESLLEKESDDEDSEELAPVEKPSKKKKKSKRKKKNNDGEFGSYLDAPTKANKSRKNETKYTTEQRESLVVNLMYKHKPMSVPAADREDILSEIADEIEAKCGHIYNTSRLPNIVREVARKKHHPSNAIALLIGASAQKARTNRSTPSPLDKKVKHIGGPSPDAKQIAAEGARQRAENALERKKLKSNREERELRALENLGKEPETGSMEKMMMLMMMKSMFGGQAAPFGAAQAAPFGGAQFGAQAAPFGAAQAAHFGGGVGPGFAAAPPSDVTNTAHVVRIWRSVEQPSIAKLLSNIP